jgi:histidinol-phosphate aminotransferase
VLKAREAVRNLNLYSPPLEGRTGLLLDFNENTAGCSPRVLARMRQLQPQQIARYPERGRGEEFVAGFLGLRASEVLLTNGVDEGIHLLCETYLEAEDEALIVVPTFSMYEIYARATGARVITVQAEDDFRFPLRAVLARLSPRTRLIAIANPNSPTGAVVEGEVLLRIVEAAPQAAVLVDEAYFEFYGETLLGQLATLPNLFVARTFSKAYGMAGLRIGVLAVQRQWRRSGLPAGSAWRSRVHPGLCCSSPPQSGAPGTRTAHLGTPVLAQPREFRPRTFGRTARVLCAGDERTRHSGA